MRHLISTLIVLFTVQLASAQNADLETLRDYFLGDYSSSQQAASNPNYNDFELHVVEIWKKSDEYLWIYTEQFTPGNVESPRQRIYQFEDAGNNKFVAYVYDMPNATDWAGAWDKPKRFKELSKDELVSLEGCEVSFLFEREEFRGNIITYCPSTRKGAQFATAELTIAPTQFLIWERGWSKEAEQAWGPKEGPYQFIKQ